MDMFQCWRWCRRICYRVNRRYGALAPDSSSDALVGERKDNRRGAGDSCFMNHLFEDRDCGECDPLTTAHTGHRPQQSPKTTEIVSGLVHSREDETTSEKHPQCTSYRLIPWFM